MNPERINLFGGQTTTYIEKQYNLSKSSDEKDDTASTHSDIEDIEADIVTDETPESTEPENLALSFSPIPAIGSHVFKYCAPDISPEEQQQVTVKILATTKVPELVSVLRTLNEERLISISRATRRAIYQELKDHFGLTAVERTFNHYMSEVGLFRQ